MSVIYVDGQHHCHREDDGTRTAVETGFFDGKCDAFVEGYAMEEKEGGYAVYPWKPYSELDAAQRQYEREKLADAENALVILLGGETL